MSHPATRMKVSRRQALKSFAAAASAVGTLQVPRAVHAQTSARIGLAVCIGLNEVDPRRYGGWKGTLRACQADARAMQSIAQSNRFFDHKLLLDGDATINNVRRHIAWAANDLRPGDIFMISYAGHGAFRTDSTGDEADGRDETWCLFDGQWPDDDRYAMWNRFAPGVRLLVVADCCHSGTTQRALQLADSFQREAGFNQESRDIEAVIGAPSRSAPAEEQARNAVNEMSRISPVNDAETMETALVRYAGDIANVLAQRDPATADYGAKFNFPSPIRAMPEPLALVLSQQQQQEQRTFSGAPRESASRAQLRAAGVLLAACQDSQTSLDGPRNGVFTDALLRCWNNGAFQGDYHRLYEAVQSALRDRPLHQPNMELFGAGAGELGKSRPFQV